VYGKQTDRLKIFYVMIAVLLTVIFGKISEERICFRGRVYQSKHRGAVIRLVDPIGKLSPDVPTKSRALRAVTPSILSPSIWSIVNARALVISTMAALLFRIRLLGLRLNWD